MQIEQVQLQNFRNYQTATLTPAPGVNILWGENGQGKTNLLEAVYLACIGKGHRAKKDAEMIRQGQDAAYVALSATRRDGPRSIEILLSQDARKRIKVFGVPISRMSELLGHVQCVLFSPEDLQLVKGGPSARRRFLDNTICQMQPAYYAALLSYNTALAQRNALLRRYHDGRAQELAALDEILARHGAAVVSIRHEMVQQLAPIAKTIHAGIAKQETLALCYHSQVAPGPKEEAKERLLSLFAARRAEDIRRVMTTVGPHRDDLALQINGREARAYASQGQQRTAVLALKLGALELMRQQTGEVPILMLDDVLSELDDLRRDALLAGITGQTLITTASALQPGQAAVLHIRNGEIFPTE